MIETHFYLSVTTLQLNEALIDLDQHSSLTILADLNLKAVKYSVKSFTHIHETLRVGQQIALMLCIKQPATQNENQRVKEIPIVAKIVDHTINALGSRSDHYLVRPQKVLSDRRVIYGDPDDDTISFDLEQFIADF